MVELSLYVKFSCIDWESRRADFVQRGGGWQEVTGAIVESFSWSIVINIHGYQSYRNATIMLSLVY